MTSLQHRVAKLALSDADLKSHLTQVLRAAQVDDETDAEARFEKGKKVPLSKLPQELQDNVEDPPAAVQDLKEKMEGKTVKCAKLDRRTLDQLVELSAQSMRLPNVRDAQATREVHQVAEKFERSLSKALSVYVQKNPPEDGSGVGDLMAAEGAYLVFMTLEGRGVGIWDGRWDDFYPDTKSLERFLKRALSREHQNLTTAIENAAYETAGGES